MTYPDGPVPNPCGEQAELFAAAAGYDRYRPGVPAEAARLLADTLADLPDPTLLDLGTGTGQVPKALLKALPSLSHIEGVDWSRQMLDQARAALTPVLGNCTLSLVQTSADVYAPLAPLPGEEWWTPDLITCCRAFHWMSGPDVLAMAHRIAAPRASLAIMGDGSLWTYEADWTGALRDLIQQYLGPGRRAGVRAAVTVHHRSPGGASRTGHFFEVRRWKGEPGIAEPDVCDAMDWAPLHALPAPMVAYCRAGLDAYSDGARLAVHFHLPGDSIAFDPGADRLRLVPDVTGQASGVRPDTAVVEFTERAVGRIAQWTDTSWTREESRVWRVHGVQGGTWYVKVHQNQRFHGREVRGLRTWAPGLGAAAPRLVAADETLRAVVLTAVPGRPLHGAVLAPDRERTVFHRIGALARRIHQSSPPRPAPAGSGPAVDKADRHLAGARSHLRPGDEEFVRELVRQVEDLPPLEWVETHGDFQLRNILSAHAGVETDDGDLFVAVIDLERSEPGPAVRDLVRLSDAWAGRPDLFEAFLAGYGRSLNAAEQARLVIDAALDSVSGISYGSSHGDPELVERGRRTLARLRAEPSSRRRRSCC